MRRAGGRKGEFGFDLHAFKRIDSVGATFRTRSLEQMDAINRLMREDLWPALQAAIDVADTGGVPVATDLFFLNKAAAKTCGEQRGAVASEGKHGG